MDTPRGLTKEDIEILSQPFPYEAHEFYRGFTYIKRDYVADRIDMVDLNWEFEPVDVYKRDHVAVARSVLTVKGIRRGDTGMATIEYVKKDGKPTDRESGEAEKAATTDSLKRCGWHFHIARYLRFAPKVRVDDSGHPYPNDLKRWQAWFTDLTGQPVTLTREEATQLALWYTQERGLSHNEARAALGVTNLTKFEGDLGKAKTQIDQWIRQQLAGAKK
jgi:hypothetical protein